MTHTEIQYQNKNGEFPKSFSAPLLDFSAGSKGKVVGVSQDNPAFLQYLDKLDIQLGSKIQVIEKIEFDQSLGGQNKWKSYAYQLRCG